MDELMTIESEEVIDEVLLSATVPNKEVQESLGLDSDSKTEKLVKFPLTRIKTLVKMDPDVHLCSQEALFLITKATVSMTIPSHTSILKVTSGQLCISSLK